MTKDVRVRRHQTKRKAADVEAKSRLISGYDAKRRRDKLEVEVFETGADTEKEEKDQ